MTNIILTIKVIPNSKITKIAEQHENYLKIKLQAPAHEGKANKALIDFLGKHLKVAKSKINIISGQKNREKIVSVDH